MKKFKFELEDLLKLRRFQQEEAEIELGKAVAEENRIQNQLDQLAEQYALAKKNTAGVTDFSMIAASQHFFIFIKQQQEKLFSDMAKAKLVTEKKRDVFRQALQKTESLSKLKEKQLDLYHQAENLEEEDVADDIVTSRYNRK